MEEDQLDSVAAGGEIEFEGIEGVFPAAGGWGGVVGGNGGGAVCENSRQSVLISPR